MPCVLLEALPEMHAAATEAGYNFKSLHSFPQDSTRRIQWYRALLPFRAEYRQPGSSDELCSLHFKPSDFEAATLKHTAIPSVFTALRRTELWELNRRLTHVARCCVPGCHTTVSFNLHPFVSEFDTRNPALARKRFRLWVRTLQVTPCESRPEVWICRRHFVDGFPADLRNFHSVDWIPTLHLEDIPRNRCRECTVVVEKLQVDVPVTVAAGEEREPNLHVPFCRLCLVQNVPLQSMFLDSSAGQQLAELIERFTTIKIDSRRDCDGAVCFKCLENLAQMEKMEQIKAHWNSKNELLDRLRANNNEFKQDPDVREVKTPPVVSIPIETLITSIIEPPPKEEDLDYDDFKQDLNPANISQDCVILEPAAEIIDLTDIDERERLINQALANLRKQFKPRKRKRSKTNLTTTLEDEPSPRKPCRNTRIG